MAGSIHMKTLEENIRKMEQLQQQHARSLNHSTRMKTIEENIRKMEQLQQEHARSLNHWMEQWLRSTNQNMTESLLETQFSARAPSNLGVELNLEAKSAKQDHGTRCSLTKDQEISAPEAVVAEDEITRGHSCGSGDYLSKSDHLHPPREHSNDDGNDDLVVKEDFGEVDSCGLVEDQVQDNIPWDSNRDQYPAKLQIKTANQYPAKLTENQEIQELQDSTVNFDTLVVVSDIASVNGSRVIVDSSIGEIVAEPIESSGFGWVDQNPNIFLDISSAHKVFVELSRLGVFQMEPTENSRVVESWVIVDRHRMVDRFSVFDPGIDDRCGFISGEFTILVLVYIEVETAVDRRNWVFDPGKELNSRYISKWSRPWVFSFGSEWRFVFLEVC